jgi:hypothetical protein
MKIEGGCHCGSIRFEAEVDSATVVICHCTDCQTFSGSAFRTVVQTKPGTFALLSGAPKVYVKTAESRQQTPANVLPDVRHADLLRSRYRDTKVVVLRVGAIHQREQLLPRDQYWFRSSLAWLPNLSKIKKQDKQPTLPETDGRRES